MATEPPSTTTEAPPTSNDTDFTSKLTSIQQKYAQEASKRLRPDHDQQFISLQSASDPRLRALEEDPWVDHAALNSAPSAIHDGEEYKVIILGGGFGGQVLAVRLLEAGIATGEGKDGLRIIDNAGGFGGTWYWNRYPGLHCDVESYCYLPLLEETGYMPRSKYSPGEEIREHAERIAGKWGLGRRALFRSRIVSAKWGEEKGRWALEVVENRGPQEGERKLKVYAEYFLTASGVFPVPQVPKIPGLSGFSGPIFHTARWDYGVTGGSQEDPRLKGIEGKRVGIIGTGATAIQVVPKVASYAKELYVFQRTPSNVWPRGQKTTDPQEWKTQIASQKGWQSARQRNFNLHLTNNVPAGTSNLVNDEWTKMTAYCAGVGSPAWGYITPTPEGIAEHIGRLLAMDLPRTELARKRVEEIVKDSEKAKKLKGWYPVWCKRPTFSDEYLETFNRENVHLVDTDGKGVDAATPSSLIVQGKEYPLDILILSTGFIGPASGGGNPSARTGVEIIGRNGLSITQKWTEKGATSLHGFFTHDFPNLFFQSPIQGSSGANYVYSIEVWSKYMVSILSEAASRSGPAKKVIFEPTIEAEEAWSGEIMRHAPYYAGIGGCTPGYITAEGAMAERPTDMAEMMKRARLGTWSFGLESFQERLEEHSKGGFEGVEFSLRVVEESKDTRAVEEKKAGKEKKERKHCMCWIL